MPLKILFLTHRLPYPPLSGGRIKSWEMVRCLTRSHDLYVACLLKEDDKIHEQEFLQLAKVEGYHGEPISRPRNALNLLKSYVQRIPLNLYRNSSKAFRRKIDALAGTMDVLLVDHYEMFQYVPDGFSGRVVLHQHNCEYLMWARYASLASNPIYRWVLQYESRRIRDYERQICGRSHCVLAAPNDIEELKKIGVDSSVLLETFHPGDLQLLDNEDLEYDSAEAHLLYVGTLDWEANADGLMVFLKECWPRLKKARPDLKLTMIGSGASARLRSIAANWKEDVVLTGFVNDLEPFFCKARVFICPLRFGSGIKVKVMNALYRGIPCVTTPVGAEGLAVRSGDQLLISRDIESMEDDIIRLMDDRELWISIRNNARSTARERYTYKAMAENIKKAVDEPSS